MCELLLILALALLIVQGVFIWRLEAHVKDLVEIVNRLEGKAVKVNLKKDGEAE